MCAHVRTHTKRGYIQPKSIVLPYISSQYFWLEPCWKLLIQWWVLLANGLGVCYVSLVETMLQQHAIPVGLQWLNIPIYKTWVVSVVVHQEMLNQITGDLSNSVWKKNPDNLHQFCSKEHDMFCSQRLVTNQGRLHFSTPFTATALELNLASQAHFETLPVWSFQSKQELHGPRTANDVNLDTWQTTCSIKVTRVKGRWGKGTNRIQRRMEGEWNES